MRLQVVPADARWPAAFRAEAERITRSLAGLDIRLHHIGSTAIPGIPAKPIIDILMEVASLRELDARTPAMKSLGYEALGEFGIPGRRYFRRNGAAGARTHQVHAFAAGSPAVARHLAFRDYMIAHPTIASEYGTLKQRLARQHPDDIMAYMDGKDAFIKHHEAQALAWVASRSGPLSAFQAPANRGIR